MLQLTKTALDAHSELGSLTPFPPKWETMEELENTTDTWMQQWLSRRSQLAHERGLFAGLSDNLDKVVRTELPEHTDNPKVSPERKLRIVRSLHRMNTLLGVYRHYTSILRRPIDRIAAARNRPVRLLELAGGSGEMAMNLARMASKGRLPVEVTCSDYVEDVVKDAERRANERGLQMSFRNVNVFDMGKAFDKGQYDVFLIIGTMHHFTPGQLAVMIAQSRRFAESGSLFVGIDGFRSIPMLCFLPTVHLITFLPDHIHDAWLTARKFYTLYELEHIAQIAAPGTRISATHSFPGLSVLKVWF